MYLTGGARSLFVPFYFAAVLTACFSLSERAAVGYASLSAILMSLVTVLYTVVPAESLPLLDAQFVHARGTTGAAYGHLLLQGVSTFIVAFLGGRLAAGLRRAEDLNNVILENLSDGVLSVDGGGAVTFVNPEALRILGVDPARASGGADVRSLLTAGEAEDLDRVLESGGTRRREVRRGGGDGAVGAYEIRISALRGPRGATSGALLVLTDFTVRKRMEEAVLAAERLQSTAQMAAGIAHEIRNPLASIRACAQEPARSLKPEGEDDARMLNVMVRESDHVNRIVSGVIDFAKPVRLHEHSFEMGALVEETVEMSRLRFAETGAPFRIEPEIPAGMVCRGDPDLLRQAFMNLTHNAFQAMEFGGGTLRIRAARARGHSGEPGVSVAFADTGSGIRPEEIGVIFDPFFTTKAGGTGLGLAVTRKIIQAHGGEIRVESAPGKGTCMTVWLPQ